MATPTNYISKITATNGTTYDIYDANAVHDVDTALSDTSTNPVQNKVVTKQKKTAIDIGVLSLVDSSTYYNTTLSSQILTDINAMTSYEGFGLTFSGVISSSTVVFNVWQTAARTISNVNWIIFSGVYGEPDTGSSPQTKMCTVSVNMTAGALYIYPITVTDTKVSLTSTTTSASYPLALGPTSITSGSAYGEYYNTSFYVNPSTLVLNTPKLTVNGGVSSYSDPVQVYTTGATNYIATFRNNTTTTSSTTYTYGVRIYAPNMVANTGAGYANFAAFDIGVAASAYNSGNMVFHYSGSGSSANFIGFGLYSHNNILSVVGTERVGIKNTAPSYELDVTGTIHASVGVKIGTSSEIKSIGSGLSVDANGALYATNATTGTVTGSGINGYLAKWTGADGQSVTELTVGPAIGTSTTTYLREDGTWATPATVSHAHGDIDYSGAITTNPGTTIASGDALLIADSSLGNTIKKSATTFGTSTTTYLRNDGTWGTPAGTDTKVTQTAITGTSTTSLYPLLLVYGTGQTATTTSTTNFTANAQMTPSGDLYVNKATSSTTFNYGANAYTQYNATLKAIEFCFA